MSVAKKAMSCSLSPSLSPVLRWEDLSEEEVIRVALHGDQKAFEYLIDRYRGLVYKNIRPFYLKGAERDDLVQEGMIGLLNAVRGYDSCKHSSFFSFADLCIRRQIMTAVKGANRHKHQPLNSFCSMDVPRDGGEDGKSLGEWLSASGSNDPERALLAAEIVEMLTAHLQRVLSPLEKQVFFSFVEGKSYRQIAFEIQRSEKSVDNALARVRSKASRVISWIRED